MLVQAEIDLLNALLTPFEQVRVRDNKAHLGGMCVSVSSVAARILNEENFRNTKWKFQRGRYGVGLTHSENYNDGHCWIVEANGPNILDLTADQFGSARIYYGPATSEYFAVIDDFGAPHDTGFYAPARAAYIDCREKQIKQKGALPNPQQDGRDQSPV